MLSWRGRLHSLLHLLLLLLMSLLELLCLLLVLLFHLLSFGSIGIAFLHLLILLFLAPCEFIPLLLLLCILLFLLLLVFLVQFWVSGIGRGRALDCRKITNMRRRTRMGTRAGDAFRARLIFTAAISAVIGWRVIRSTCSSSRNDTLFEVTRTRRSRNFGLTTIDGGALLRIAPRFLRVLCLGRYGLNVPLTCDRFLLRSRTGGNSAVAAVIADSILGAIHNGCVVNVVDLGDIYVVNGAVVKEVSVVPAAALVAFTKISKPVVDAAVKTYLRSPITIVEDEPVAAPAPIHSDDRSVILGYGDIADRRMQGKLRQGRSF